MTRKHCITVTPSEEYPLFSDSRLNPMTFFSGLRWLISPCTCRDGYGYHLPMLRIDTIGRGLRQWGLKSPHVYNSLNRAGGDRQFSEFHPEPLNHLLPRMIRSLHSFISLIMEAEPGLQVESSPTPERGEPAMRQGQQNCVISRACGKRTIGNHTRPSRKTRQLPPFQFSNDRNKKGRFDWWYHDSITTGSITTVSCRYTISLPRGS